MSTWKDLEPSDFVSLVGVLAGCFGKPLEELTDAQRLRVEHDLAPLRWGDISQDERRAAAEQWDRRKRPMTEAEAKAVDKHLLDLANTEADAKYWESRSHESAHDAEVRLNRLEPIKKHLAAFEAQHKVRRGDYHSDDSKNSSAGDPPVTPDHWKMRVQVEAAVYMKKLRGSGANPTVHGILDRMVAWCRDNDVRTSTGVVPTAGYLRTHVLGGKHWTPPR